MGMLQVRLLGGLDMEAEGRALSLSARKARALLAYLAFHAGRPFSREQLSALLWEEHDPARARQSLRQVLTVLRSSLAAAGAAPPQVEGDHIGLHRESVQVDVHALERRLDVGAGADLLAAVELYRGDLLAGFDPRAPAYEEWLAGERARLRERMLAALDSLLSAELQGEAGEPAVALALRILHLDPLREPAHRALMRLYARQGRTGLALSQYRRCRDLLRDELGVAPEAATEDLAREILTSRRARAAVPEPTERRPPAATESSLPEMTSPEVTEPALRQAAVLVARIPAGDPLGRGADPEEELARLQRLEEAVNTLAAGTEDWVARVVGERLELVFGLPTARGNEAERCLRVALALRREPALAVSTGIAVGPLLALARGQDGPADWRLAGETLHLAHRLADQAGGGEILISEGTRRALRGLAQVEPASSDPVSAWRLLHLLEPDSWQPAGPFVGRRAEREHLLGLLQAILEGEGGRAVLVRGEAGIGKSRLLAEVRAEAEHRGFTCHVGQLLDFGASATELPPQVLARSLVTGCPKPAPQVLPQAADAAELAGWIEPEQRVYLNDLLDLPQPPQLRALYDALDEPRRRDGRERVLLSLLAGAARERPRCLLVEDLHWADADTCSALARLARQVPELPVLLLMTRRAQPDTGEEQWSEVLHGLPVTTLDLAPLRPHEAEALAQALGGQLTAEERERRLRRADGNPLFLEQLLQAESDQEVPDSVRSMVTARLDRLSEADRQAARAASVLGQRVELAALRDLLESPDYDGRGLLAARLLRPEGSDLVFAHALLLEATYATLLRSQREALHRRAASWLAERDPALRAEHLERAGDPAAASAYLAAAAAEARAYHHQRALGLAARGLGCAADDATRVRLHCFRGQLLAESGRTEESLAEYRLALPLAPEGVAAAKARIGLGAGLSVQDRHQEALTWLDEAERLLGPSGHPEVRAQLHYHRGNAMFPLGRAAECLREQEIALAAAREVASPELEARALSGLGDAHYLNGRVLSARSHFERCVQICREHALGRIETSNRAMLGLTRFYSQGVSPARADLEQAAARAEAVGDLRGEVLAREVLAQVCYYQGDCETAQGLTETALALARTLGSRRMELENLFQLGALAAGRGDGLAGVEAVERALALSQEIGTAYAGAWVLATLAKVSPDRERSRRALDEGEALLGPGHPAHNFLHFYQIGIDVALTLGDWPRLARYADALEAYTRPEPLLWSSYFAARGRALARWAQGERGTTLAAELRALGEQARLVGYGASVSALEQALAEA